MSPFYFNNSSKVYVVGNSFIEIILPMLLRTIKICPKCKTSNEKTLYCVSCGELLDLNKKREIARTQKKAFINPIQKPNKLTLFFENAKDHKCFLIRWFARFFYSIWVLGLAIAFVFGMVVLYLAA